MSESHSKGEQRHRPLGLAVTDSRSAMTRASDGRPFRPYVYRGGEKEPAAVIAVRQRHRALDDERQRQRERGGALAPVRAPEDQELAELDAERDRYQAAVPEPREPDPAPAPTPVAAASRCRRCGYLTTSAGHRVMCDD